MKAFLFLIPAVAFAGEPAEDRYLNLLETTDRIVGGLSEMELQLAANCQVQSYLAAHLLKTEPMDINIAVNQKVHKACNHLVDFIIENTAAIDEGNEPEEVSSTAL